MSDKDAIKEALLANDPAMDIDFARLGRSEALLMARLAATPQGTFLPMERSVLHDFVLPLWRGSLLAVLLLALGMVVGASVRQQVGAEGSMMQDVAQLQQDDTQHVTLFAMAAPWQPMVGE